jgi:hypothetical protein
MEKDNTYHIDINIKAPDRIDLCPICKQHIDLCQCDINEWENVQIGAMNDTKNNKVN